MNKIFVHYDVDYDIYGLQEFDTREQAAEFIGGHLRFGAKEDDFVVIEGKKMGIEPEGFFVVIVVILSYLFYPSDLTCKPFCA